VGQPVAVTPRDVPCGREDFFERDRLFSLVLQNGVSFHDVLLLEQAIVEARPQWIMGIPQVHDKLGYRTVANLVTLVDEPSVPDAV
jgi:hypothetical protein